jgi:Skp family chaperone for outer membrane proteins
MRKFAWAACVILVAFAVASAEEFTASVSKFEDGKITFTKFGKKGDGKVEPTTLPVAADCKYMKAKFNQEEKKFETDGALEGGKEAFEKRVKEAAAKKKEAGDDAKKKKGFGGFGGVIAQIVTEGEGDKAKVTEIRLTPGFGGKKKKDAN